MDTINSKAATKNKPQHKATDNKATKQIRRNHRKCQINPCEEGEKSKSKRKKKNRWNKQKRQQDGKFKPNYINTYRINTSVQRKS